MLAAQATRAQRLAVADDVIHNDGDIAVAARPGRKAASPNTSRSQIAADAIGRGTPHEHRTAARRRTRGLREAATVAQNSAMSEEAQQQHEPRRRKRRR